MPKISIIIVHYNEGKVLFNCLKSIYKNSPKSSFEIVVVDNDVKREIKQRLHKQFPKVVYIESPGDLGYGKGNNLGVNYAKGEYVFILNPDTIVQKGAIDTLLKFSDTNKDVGIVAPTLSDKDGKCYPMQGTKKLTPVRGVFALSFLNKIFPNNPISKEYWLKDSDRSKPLEVDVVPGTAFLIRKTLYKKVGGFDKNFFLYFEETDFCNRVQRLGKKLFILPDAKMIHFWAVSTPASPELKKIFAESRFYYFKKNFGILNAYLVEFFARLNKTSFLLLIIMALGTFLRFYRLLPNLLLNGEMGTDYMNVWNIIHGTRTWLIGPQTSHTWFSIPPISYWIYTALLFVFNYNPASINVFWAVVGTFAIWVCYYYTKKLFDERIALISSLLLAVSPGFIFYTRASRYNAPIAILFFPYLYYLKRSIDDKGKSLGMLGLILGLSMSFFPSPFLFIPAVVVSFLFYKVSLKFKYILQSIIGFFIPNITYLIYDALNYFRITKEVALWIPFRILGFFGFYPKNTATPIVISQNISSIYKFFAEMFSPNYQTIAMIIFMLIFLGTIIFLIKALRARKSEMAFILLIINLIVTYIGLFVHGNPPEHYYLVIYPIPLILAAYILSKTFKSRIAIFLTIILGVIGVFNLLKANWFYQDAVRTNYTLWQPPYSVQKDVVAKILTDAAGRQFSLARIGSFDKFENNFESNYIYLLTIKNAHIEQNSNTLYTIVEDRTEGKAPLGVEIWSESGVQIFKLTQK